jgi:adenylate kinase
VRLKVIITGVNGAGKTTVTEYLKREMSSVAIFNYGDKFKEVLEREFPEFKGIPRDQWNKVLSKEQQRLIQVKAAELIKKDMEGKEHVLIDVNLVLRRKEGYLPGLPEDVLRLLNPDVIVVMEVHPEIIQERRKMDFERKKRQREVETVDEIKREQELQRMFAANCALLTGCLVEILDFKARKDRGTKDAEDAAKRIKEIFTGGIRAGR